MRIAADNDAREGIVEVTGESVEPLFEGLSLPGRNARLLSIDGETVSTNDLEGL